MAGSHLHRSPYRNPPGTGGDKSARGTQWPPPANGSNSSLPTPPPANSCILTPAASCTSTPVPAFTPTPTPVLAPAKYTDAGFYQFMKVFMDIQRCSRTYEGPRESLFKAYFPNLYYRKSHIDCYQFCLQFEDYFETAGAAGPNCVLFAALFLYRPINFRWH